MSKRQRNRRQKGNSADHQLPEEPVLVINSQAFEAFAAQIDQSLLSLVERWKHTAAPAASMVRRFVPVAQPRPREEA